MKYLLLFLFTCSVVFADNIKISQLPLGTAANTGVNDSFPYVDATSGVTKRLTVWDIVNVPTVKNAFTSILLPDGYIFVGSAAGYATGVSMSGDVTIVNTGATTVGSVGGATAANIATASTLANAATSSNTASTIVKRDSSGNFTAGTITAALSGNATTATSVSGTVAVANGGTGLTSGTSGGIPYYSSSSAMTSSGVLANHSVVIGGGAAATPKTIGTGTTGSLLQGVSSADPAFTSNAVLGLAGSATGSLGLSGTTSGTVTIQPQAVAGSYNFNLPVSAGSSGQPLLSAAGGSSPMTFGTLGVAAGGTGLTGGTSGGIPYYSSSSAITSSGVLASHSVMIGGGAGATPTTIGTGTTGSILQGTSSADPAFTANPVVGLAGTATGSIGLSGTTSGTVTIQPQAAAGTYNFNLPITAGSSGQPLLSAAGGSSPMTFGTLGVAAGGTGLTGGTSGGIPYYSSSSAITSSGVLANHSVVIGGGAGATPTTIGTGAGGTILQGVASSDPAFTATPTLGVAGTTLGTLALTGNTSGTITIQPQAVAGSYNFNLPNAAGSSGQVLSSGGGGSTAMSWITPSVRSRATSSTLNTEIVERAVVSCSSSATIPSQSGTWLSAIGNVSSGCCTLTIATGIFSATPACVVSLDSASSGAYVANVDVSSATAATVCGQISGSPITNVGFWIICMGAQ